MLLLPAVLSAETYSMQQCIDTALVRNLSVLSGELQTETYRLNYQQQRQNLLPHISGSVGQSFSFGRSTGVDNITRSQNIANTSIGLNASLVLFDGLGMKFRIDEARASMQASEADLEKLKADIRINICGMFLKALLNKELLAVADSQLLATAQRLERTERMVESGRTAEGELYQQRAQYAGDELNRTQAENNLRLALLDLAQAMEIPYDPDFDITAPDNVSDAVLLPDNDEVYAEALRNRPEIRAGEAQLQAQESALKGAKAAWSPTLSAGAGLNTGYYHLFGADNTAFGKQLGDNFSTSVGLNLTIPIFDRMQTPNAVKKQKINIENTKIQIEQTKKDLRKEIDQAYYNAVAAQQQQTSAAKAEISAAEAYRYAGQKYDAGRASFYELNDAKNTYIKAKSELLQAEYNYRFKVLILHYYTGK